MEEYISKRKFMEYLADYLEHWEDSAKEYKEDKSGVTALKCVAKSLCGFVNEDVREEIHAKWIERDAGKGTRQYICSNCNDYHEFRSDSTNQRSVKGNFLYCRKCGAKMDLE